MVDDVEKRWRDPRMFRRAASYVVSVLATAMLVFLLILLWSAQSECVDADTLLCDTTAETAVVIGPSAVLLIGGIGAFVETYLQWRRGRAWPIWQGAGWFLFVLMVVYLGIGGGAAAS